MGAHIGLLGKNFPATCDELTDGITMTRFESIDDFANADPTPASLIISLEPGEDASAEIAKMRSTTSLFYTPVLVRPVVDSWTFASAPPHLKRSERVAPP